MCTYQDQCDKHKCDDKIICVDNEWRDVTSQVLYNIAKSSLGNYCIKGNTFIQKQELTYQMGFAPEIVPDK